MRDIGANLTSKQFANDLGEVITRAVSAGVAFIDVTGTDLASSERSIQLSRQHPGRLGATAGIHPHAAKTCDAAALEALRSMLALPETLMCGEMGLDYARNFSTPSEQRRAFDSQLELAEEVGKPLFLHCRDAFEDFIAALDKRPRVWPRSIVHCFTGTQSQMETILERGGHIGVTGWIADKRRNANLLLALKKAPLDRLLVETDAPYLMPLNAPHSQARDRNEPANLSWVVKALAEAIGADPAEVAARTWANAESLIGRPATLDTGPASASAPKI